MTFRLDRRQAMGNLCIALHCKSADACPCILLEVPAVLVERDFGRPAAQHLIAETFISIRWPIIADSKNCHQNVNAFNATKFKIGGLHRM